MRITKNTKYWRIERLEPYLKEESKHELMAAAEKEFGSMYDLTFAEFWECSSGNFSRLGDTSNPTVLQVYWYKRFKDFVNEFANTLKKLVIQQTPEETQASQGLIKVSWDEAILVFVQQWFGLKSYKEAEQITIGEILIAKRAAYNRDKFSRQIGKIQMSKLNKK